MCHPEILETFYERDLAEAREAEVFTHHKVKRLTQYRHMPERIQEAAEETMNAYLDFQCKAAILRRLLAGEGHG